ncbi:MAG: RNA pseudouridine synthase, partial [Spirochaetes bacterium]|nr:RNA pseudouridine synthase [Spirochaetota bacterium]
IIYEDEYLIAVNKPAGLLVIPSKNYNKPTLTDLVTDHLQKNTNPIKAHPCHRLDRETSGITLYAKGKKKQQVIMELFRQRQIKKEYLAILNGCIKKAEGTINFPIDKKEAITKYQVITKNSKYSVVLINLLTGRTNQIRIHFNSIGHPLLGDCKFGIRKDFHIKMKRTALHALKLEFSHPFTHKLLELEADVPDDLKKLLV